MLFLFFISNFIYTHNFIFNCYFIGSFVHDDGTITVKRYDGSIFGEAINTGSNIHTIQEIDLTVLFDSESNESDFREVDYAN